ncbi:phage protein [Streptococcus pneumoniae]|nr:phage protein [Streptococcus pneumoniae]VIX05066.1 phage protein [Streptococcus pneumoniae]VIX55727.1 phage protein [Streptococcus pneumoniae]VIZ42049.1 phage protein [Streptococcus pneumoniae]VJG29734.1 phage protein [Streptococcus pneumoniae]
MKLNELIKKYKKLEGVWNAEGAELVRQIFLQDLEQLDKPQPVKVPQCVAEYIEFKKKNNFHVYGLAWINGYEVEKEKRYFVKIKGNIKENMLVYGELLKRYFFTKSFSLDDVIYSHTRKELEAANFGWVFDCPGIEIEEVE